MLCAAAGSVAARGCRMPLEAAIKLQQWRPGSSCPPAAPFNKPSGSKSSRAASSLLQVAEAPSRLIKGKRAACSLSHSCPACNNKLAGEHTLGLGEFPADDHTMQSPALALLGPL